MLHKAPEISTERLLLRAHRREDFEPLAAMWADPEVVRHITGTPSTPEASWARLLRYGGHWAMMGFGYWALEDRATGRFAGEMGLADYQRGIAGYEGWPEAGWVLAPAFQGRGLAAEAMTAAFAWAGANLAARDVFCILAPEHAASIRLAVKLGFHESARCLYHDEPSLVMQRPLGNFPRMAPEA